MPLLLPARRLGTDSFRSFRGTEVRGVGRRGELLRDPEVSNAPSGDAWPGALLSANLAACLVVTILNTGKGDEEYVSGFDIEKEW